MKSNLNFTTCILVLMMVCMTLTIKAQQPIIVSVFNESTTIPFTTFFNTPAHPGLQLGTEFEWKRGRHFRLYPTINVGYIFHRKLFQGIYTNVEIGWDFKTSFGLNLKSKIGIGYLRTYTIQQEFQFENRQYKSRKDKGNARIMPSVSFGIGYDVRKKDNYSPEIFIMYQAWLEYPYSPGFIPIMTHTNFHLGSKFFINQNKKNK